MNTIAHLLPLFVLLKVTLSCTDDCSFNDEDSIIPSKGIGIDWGVFFSQIQVTDFRFFGLLGIEMTITLATILISSISSACSN